MEVKRILWPTDLSGRAKHALAYVRSLTEKYGAEIHVLYVITDIGHHRGLYGNFEQAHIDRIYAWEKEKASERLDKICSQELEGCPLYVKHIAVGDPAQGIIKTALKKRSTWWFWLPGVQVDIFRSAPWPIKSSNIHPYRW